MLSPRLRVSLTIALLALSFASPAREALLIDEMPANTRLSDVSITVMDVLAGQHWRILPGDSEHIRASHFDARNICRFEIVMRGNRLFINDDCRKATGAQWVDSAERRAVPESWLRPVRTELRRRFPRPTPEPEPLP